MNAYDELYLNKARTSLGSMLHFAVYDLKYDLTEFYRMCLNSGIAERFGHGESGLIAGRSGIELAYTVLYTVTGKYCNTKPSYAMNKSPEYWAGWALAYYQWHSNQSFNRIDETVPIKEIVNMYSPLHEADILKYVEIMDNKMSKSSAVSRLARLRSYAGLTQRMLADRSGVSIRMIEQYEQGRKDLSKASAETILKLSQVLRCSMEELL